MEIVARHQALVCGVALGVTHDFAASEDVAQEAFLTAWRKIQELREPEKLRGWLAQIARNAALGHLRRRKPSADLQEAEDMADDAALPDAVAASTEEARLVEGALNCRRITGCRSCFFTVRSSPCAPWRRPCRSVRTR